MVARANFSEEDDELGSNSSRDGSNQGSLSHPSCDLGTRTRISMATRESSNREGEGSSSPDSSSSNRGSRGRRGGRGGSSPDSSSNSRGSRGSGLDRGVHDEGVPGGIRPGPPRSRARRRGWLQCGNNRAALRASAAPTV